jgi:WD40 repeat protein
VAISPDGKMLLTGCGDMTDGLACLWTLPPGDGASPQRLLREGAVWAVAFSPDGQMVTRSGLRSGRR